jgi:hypothetical protein
MDSAPALAAAVTREPLEILSAYLVIVYSLQKPLGQWPFSTVSFIAGPPQDKRRPSWDSKPKKWARRGRPFSWTCFSYIGITHATNVR